MRRFRDVSIKSKLIVITMLTSSATLFVVCLVFVAHDFITFRRSMVRDLTILAQMIGSNCTAALAFNDRAAAEETLAGLRADPHVVAACVYARNDSVFATYERGGARHNFPPLPAAPVKSARFTTEALIVFQPIMLDSDGLGTTYIIADLGEIAARLVRYAGVVALVTLASTAMALFLSARLQRVISKPILDLAQVAGIVSSRKDYSVRAEKRGDDEIGSLIGGFNDMLGQIQGRDEALQRRTAQLAEANRELESFSYSVSHDLRVPLRAVNGLCRVLAEEHAGRLDPEGMRILELMRGSAVQMSKLIDDLLEFSRLGSVEIRKRRIDMTALAREVVGELLTLDPERPVAVEVEDLPPASGEPTLIRQVLVNLMSNALKFTRECQSARIRIGTVNHDGQTAYLVQDNGVGFDMAYAHKLFNVFQRLHSSKSFEGTGVGLAIVQHIVRRHEGRIWAEAEPGAGATFYFTLGAAPLP